MGYDWTHAAVHNKQTALGERLVLFTLAECADNETGTCYPSVSSIAERANLSERATQYALRKLVDLGLITVQRNASQYGTNIYTLSPSLKGGAKSAPGGATQFTGGVQPTAPEPSVEPSKKKERVEKEKVSTPAPIPDDWKPNDKNREYGKNYGMTNSTINFQADAFRDWHILKGTRSLNWSLNWNQWVRHWVEYGKKQAPRDPSFGRMTPEQIASGHYA